MSNIERHPQCLMRTALGNCDPIGGFCTSVNESICDALHKASRPQSEWINVGTYEECKNCGEIRRFPHWNFCPNCGAIMKGVNNE